ncbi:MAG: putative repair helicase RadD [Candidatus Saccharibacteria bacterium]|nr:putative repair helicase RadD [Candidatus Saccharibacteria bacterium]
MNEATTRLHLIDPQIRDAKWGLNETIGSQVIAEYGFTDGRLIGAGQRGSKKKADYILAYKSQKLAIVEAKAEDKEVTDGLEQVKGYAQSLNIRYVYSTNGHGIYFFDMRTSRGKSVDRYHTPEELFSMTFDEFSEAQKTVLTEPFQRSKFNPRYYQENAVNKAIEAISAGEKRVLLTLATGTGKTTIAFQIVWKLYQARWNKRNDGRRPRILFLADRNVLVEQAMGDFNPLENEIVRINGDAVRKAGKIPTNGNIFFSIYQAMTGGPIERPYYSDYPEDFFDLIVIDECHRGGASNESNWRAVLDHFTGATHLGLTATPKRDDNVDTYAYFGNPRYVYSLKEGIEDGFLTPFKVKRITTTMDRYIFHPTDTVESGEVDADREYTLSDFNNKIYLPEREARMVQIMLEEINPSQKTIIFCNDEKHAAMIRDAVNEYKPEGILGNNVNYCVRITASEKEVGDQYLRKFRDNERQIPTIVTTSRKLSTGVDARNVRFVVLMRNVGSMIEFKQIIGRGTRIYDGKDYFTIVDFYGNDTKFQDPEWDGEPAEVESTDVDSSKTLLVQAGLAVHGDGNDEIDEPVIIDNDWTGERVVEKEKKQKTVVRLADGKSREIKYSIDTLFYMEGKPVGPSEFLELLFGKLPDFYTSEEDLQKQWSDPRTRRALLHGLAERGFDEEKLEKLKELIDAEDSDVYDVLRYVSYAKETMTRYERALIIRNYYLEQLEEGERDFVSFVLDTYEKSGENELSMENLRGLVQLKYRTMPDAVKHLGSAQEIVHDYLELQHELYVATEA